MASGINNRNIITLTETDEVDSPIATYVYSESGSPDSGVGRIDVVVRQLSIKIHNTLAFPRSANLVPAFVFFMLFTMVNNFTSELPC